MWAENLVSQLSAKACQVLLALLLTRQVQVQKTAMEFAKLTGLSQRSIGPALLELKSAGLIDIIPQPGKPSLVRLIHPEEYRYETTVTDVGPAAVEEGASGLLLASGNGDAGEGRATKDDTPSGTGLAAPGERVLSQRLTPSRASVRPEALIDQCRMADESKDKELRIASLQDVWDFAFPFDEYPDPTQRMSNWFAQHLLVNRSAEWMGQVILDSVQHATSRIQSPRGYIEKAVANEERRGALKEAGMYQSGQVLVTDELRRLVELGKEQFGAKSKDSPGDKP